MTDNSEALLRPLETERLALPDDGPIADAAREIASYCDAGTARWNVYRSAKQHLAKAALAQAASSPVQSAADNVRRSVDQALAATSGANGGFMASIVPGLPASSVDAPPTDVAGKGVQITARQQTPIVADYGDHFLVAHVNKEGTQVGIDHPCDAVWSDVMVAHVALRDYINERIERQDSCPFKAKALAQSTASSDDVVGLVEALAKARALGDELADALTLRTHGSRDPREDEKLSAWDAFSFNDLRAALERLPAQPRGGIR